MHNFTMILTLVYSRERFVDLSVVCMIYYVCACFYRLVSEIEIVNGPDLNFGEYVKRLHFFLFRNIGSVRFMSCCLFLNLI